MSKKKKNTAIDLETPKMWLSKDDADALKKLNEKKYADRVNDWWEGKNASEIVDALKNEKPKLSDLDKKIVESWAEKELDKATKSASTSKPKEIISVWNERDKKESDYAIHLHKEAYDQVMNAMDKELTLSIDEGDKHVSEESILLSEEEKNELNTQLKECRKIGLNYASGRGFTVEKTADFIESSLHAVTEKYYKDKMKIKVGKGLYEQLGGNGGSGGTSVIWSGKKWQPHYISSDPYRREEEKSSYSVNLTQERYDELIANQKPKEWTDDVILVDINKLTAWLLNGSRGLSETEWFVKHKENEMDDEQFDEWDSTYQKILNFRSNER